MRNRRYLLPIYVLALACLLGPAADSIRAAEADRVDFGREILPILTEHCFKCHGPDEQARKGDLRLDTRPGAVSGELPVIEPGSADDSELILRVEEPSEKMRMPPRKVGRRLTAGEVDLLRRWIDQGAEYTPHWSLVAPEDPVVPTLLPDLAKHARGEIDAFILDRLQREGLAPRPEADRYVLARRLALDLTGLPPTPEQVDAFVSDDDPRAYESYVDGLLDSPAYGERFAKLWLDLARYADSQGYEKDARRVIWNYRDWVIRAFNRDMPFDRFTTLQIAGDLLPDPSLDQLVATAFHRNTMTNDEGGTDDEEFRVAAVADRVDTTMQVWMGMTMGCAQCHTHKYDPISHEEYYRFFAFFNQTEDADIPGDAPTIPTPGDDERRALDRLIEGLVRTEATLAALEPDVVRARDAWIHGDRQRPPGDVDKGLGYRLVVEDCFVGEAAAGLTGTALGLDGEGHVDLGGLGDFDRDDAFSFGGWIFPEAKGVQVPFARMDATNAYRGYDLYMHDGNVYVHLIHRYAEDAIEIASLEPLPVSEWSHVFVTVDGSGKAAGVRLYVNGAPRATRVVYDRLKGTIRTERPFYLGGRFEQHGFRGRIDDFRLYDCALAGDEIAAVAARGAAAADSGEPEHAKLLDRYYRLHHSPEAWREARATLARMTREEVDLRAKIPTTPVMRELPQDKRRKTFVHLRGNFLDRGAEVAPGVPAAFHPLPEDASPDRLGLANWLVAEQNPLTARVFVNRIWEQIFGAGIVETCEDFGIQGTPPTHPELLDWLALSFARDEWSVKRLVKRIVSSAAYRRGSSVTSELLERDPRNSLLSRGPRFRLDAETVRDQALALSGLLSAKMYGPPVFPPQPEGTWQVVYDGAKWQASEGDDRYRRALYTYWRRTSPYPSMATFDAPSREVCTSRRIRTNTPLQALVTLNDPAFFEAARAMARRLVLEIDGLPSDRARYGLRLCVAREPSPEEIASIVALFESESRHYRGDPASAAQVAGVDGAGPTGDGQTSRFAELAAWTIVCNVLLNLDETLTKG